MSFEETLIKQYGFNIDDAKATANLFESETVCTKNFFVKEGEIAKKLAIIVSGLLRTYFFNENGDEITTAFHEPGTILLSAESFNNQVRSKENIVVIDDADLLTITYNNWVRLNEEVPIWKDICKKTGDIIGQELLNRAKELQTYTAKERYNSFIKEHPLVYQKATLGQIASYLGIDIATLSRIRKSN